MIQRIQTLFLLLSGACAGLIFFDKDPDIHTILSGVTALVALVAIFLYKRRRWQMTLSIFGMLLFVAVMVLHPVMMTFIASGIGIVFFILACRFIHKDEMLVRSLDRIR